MRSIGVPTLAAAFCLLLLGSCGNENATDPVRAASPTESSGGGSPTTTDRHGLPPAKPASAYGLEDPPRFTLFLDRGDVRLSPWTACVGNGCFDGAPPDESESAGSAQQVEFGFDIVGWDFEATFRETGKKCPRMITVPAHEDRRPHVRR
jgi:hypothetical protein